MEEKLKKEFEKRFPGEVIRHGDNEVYMEVSSYRRKDIWSFISSALKEAQRDERRRIFKKLRRLGTKTWMSDTRFGRNYEGGIFVPETISRKIEEELDGK